MTKKITRLRLPSVRNHGCISQSAPITTATQTIAASNARTFRVCASRNNEKTAISAMPMGSAAARQILEICRAGVVM